MSSLSGIASNVPANPYAALAAQKASSAAAKAPATVRDSDGDFDGSRVGDADGNKGKAVDKYA